MFCRSASLSLSQTKGGKSMGKDCSGCWSLSTNWKGRNVMFPNDFVMELLSRSRSLEVISLLYLRERVRKIYEEALKRNEC